MGTRKEGVLPAGRISPGESGGKCIWREKRVNDELLSPRSVSECALIVPDILAYAS